MIKLKNVSKKFGSTQAVDDITLDIDQGQVVGFLGPNGAGKSTTMRMITGFLAPDTGVVEIDGINVSEDASAIKCLIGYLPENNPLYEEMLVRDFLRFTAQLRGLGGDDAPLTDIVEQVGIQDVFYRPIGELSKGYRQRVGLAQAILHQPQILILDEPTEGLDPNQRVEIRKLITDIGKKRTVVLSTHVLQEVESTCGRVIIIDKGRLVVDSAIEDLVNQSKGAKKLVVEIAGPSPAAKLKSLSGVVSADKLTGAPKGRHRFSIVCDSDCELRPQIFRLAQDNDWVLWELFQEETSLEDVFRNLTIGEENV
ncbi:MAG TPA: ATP-binding cassette domain-containing protein [Actinobacteria bacterium]|nr:ATP-binding cassette domain-containing protein [Actinomycetota bacterium]